MNSTTRSNGPGIVVIGIGNEYRSDDALGIIAARAIRKELGDSVRVCEHHRDGSGLMDLWEGAETVLLIDAVSSGAPAGFVVRKEISDGSISEIPFRHSTHSIGIADGIAYARLAGILPGELIFFGIEGKNFSPGGVLSREVAAALPTLIRDVKLELGDLMCAQSAERRHA